MKSSIKLIVLLCVSAVSFSANAQLALSEAVNESAVKEGNVRDITAPRTDLLRSEAGTFIYGPTSRMKFKVIEEESGVKTTFFKLASFPYMKSDGRQMMPHELEDGEHTILYYSVDNDGNQEQIRRDVIYLDKNGPEVTSTFNVSPVSFEEGVPVFPSNVQLVVEVSDKMVDVQKVVYQINDLEKVESDNLSTIDLTAELQKVTDKNIQVTITSYDAFYNIDTEVIEFKILR